MSETGPPSQPDEAMVDLLIKQVTEGLSPAEQRELDVLDSALASKYARDFERAAAAIVLAGSASAEPPPAALLARIEEEAHAFFASAAGAAAPASADKVVDFRAASRAAPPASSARATSAGWWAAAACLVLAALGWLRSPSPVPVATVPPPTPAVERAALLARSDSLRINLGATQDPAAAGLTGDVVWNPVTQQGFLRFAGLKPNDPRLHQYQLWIFDGERDQRYPVDGGVFNVPANVSEVLVPIRAVVPVHTAKAFAVTIENPGGAVVSARDHVIALGQIS